MPHQSCSSVAEARIEYTLNMFGHLVDAHSYTALDMVFTADAVANFATPAGYIQGLSAIEQGLEKSLSETVSQHALSTYVIKVLDTNSTEATAITYLQGTIFGQGGMKGQFLTTFGS